METETKRLGFFDQVIYSVQPKRYKDLAMQPRRKVMSFVLILGLVLAIMNFIIPTAGFAFSVGGFENFIVEVLPDIELSGGKLSVDSRIEIGKDTLTHILVDTSVAKVDEKSLGEGYVSEVLIAGENMIVDNGEMGAYEISFSQFGNISIDNKGLLDLLPFVYMVLVVSFFANMLTTLTEFLFFAAFIALFCWGPFSMRDVAKISYGKAFALAVYAHAVPELIVAFNGSAGIISNQLIVSYAATAAAMFLLVSGIRHTQEKRI